MSAGSIPMVLSVLFVVGVCVLCPMLLSPWSDNATRERTSCLLSFLLLGYYRDPKGKCKMKDGYIKGHGYSYWYRLEFDAQGTVQQFRPFVHNFTLDLA
jgi:hypothetical protein